MSKILAKYISHSHMLPVKMLNWNSHKKMYVIVCCLENMSAYFLRFIFKYINGAAFRQIG